MTKTAQDFECYQGETKQVTINTDDGNGDPKTLTGGTIIWEVFRSREDPRPEAVLKKSGADITLVDVDGTDDGIRFTIDPADNARLSGAYEHEARAKDAAGNEAVVAVGTMTVKSSPSRD